MNHSLFKDAWLETKNTWQKPPGWNWAGERYCTRDISFLYDKKFFPPIFLSSLFWKVKRRGHKVITRSSISIYLSKFTTLKNLSQLLPCWFLCHSKDLSCLLPPSSFMLSTSNISNILSDTEFVILHLQFPSFPPWLHSLLTVCQGESGRHSHLCFTVFFIVAVPGDS